MAEPGHVEPIAVRHARRARSNRRCEKADLKVGLYESGRIRYFARPLIPSAIIATLYTEPPPTMNRVFLSRPANAGA